MLETLIDFLRNNKEVFAAIAAILESIAVIYNLWRKWKTKKGMVVQAASPSFFRSALWVINPINCFRPIFYLEEISKDEFDREFVADTFSSPTPEAKECLSRAKKK